MSRFCGERNSAPLLEAAQHWRQQCLEKDGSVFSEQPLWSAQNFEALERYFIGQLEAGERSFFEKLQDQLSPTTPDVKKLAAEMLWVMLLCPSNITADKKREIVNRVWNWSGQTLPSDSTWLSPAVLIGVGSAGTSYSTRRWRELPSMLNLSDLRTRYGLRIRSEGCWAAQVTPADVMTDSGRRTICRTSVEGTRCM